MKMPPFKFQRERLMYEMSQKTFNPTEQIAEEVQNHRKADYPINPLFLNRWSPRSYSDRIVSEQDLLTVLEAARWTPSAGNRQPWRFIIAKTEEQLQTLRELVQPSHRPWTDKAPAIIVLASYKLKPEGGSNPYHALDTGAAWQSIALQASLLGLSTRAIANFDNEKARQVLNVPEDYDLHLFIPIGYRGEIGDLHEDFRDREKPNDRRPLNEFIIEGKWKSAE